MLSRAHSIQVLGPMDLLSLIFSVHVFSLKCYGKELERSAMSYSFFSHKNLNLGRETHAYICMIELSSSLVLVN